MSQLNKREPLIETRKLKKFFPLKRKSIFQLKRLNVRAIEDINLTIYKGETLGLVGESGCGKSTLGRVILQLYQPTSGSSLYYGIPLREANPYYIIRDIKRLPKLQAQAANYYGMSLVYDEKIEQLTAELNDEVVRELKQKNAEQIESIKKQIESLKVVQKQYIEESIKKVNEVYANYLATEKEEDPTVKRLSVENEVNYLLELMKDETQTGVQEYIKLLPIPYKEIDAQYKKVTAVTKQIEKLNKNIHNLSTTSVERKIERLKYKSKECKKEASRKLREGSETCGEFILEKDINIISELMLEEELTHREAFALKKELKTLSKKPTEHVERINELTKEIERLEAKQENLNAQLKTYHFKDPQPITERCLEPEYQQKMESNRQFALNLQKIRKEEMRKIRHRLQIIFQDPYSSLDPRMTVGQAISEAVVEHGMFPKGSKELEDYVIDTMAKCGLDHYMIHRYPHQFSGGQRQRIVIARALALNPEFVVCDESVSALDVSIQSQILNLLEELKAKNNLTYLFISHDLSVIKHISDRIGVMYLGDLVELCEAETLYENPLHPYSKALISAIPTTSQEKKKRIILEGDIPSNIFPPSGCKFRTRCPLAREKCAKVAPKLEEVEPGHMVSCHFYEETKKLG